jgi:hypothetical protein
MPSITITLTDDEIHAILETAGDHGSGYWARTNKPLTAALQSRVLVHDKGGEPQGWLTAAKLRKAGTRLAELAQKGECAPSILSALVIDPCGMDSIGADAFVQIALFGELRYA